MANHEIRSPRAFTQELRRHEVTDLVHANNYNAVAGVLINNDAWLEEQAGLALAHAKDKNNPHDVTKEQIGLGNVDNTADIDKPLSKDQSDAITNIVNNLGEIAEPVTYEKNGLMTSADKIKLDGIEELATAGSKNALLFGETTGEAGLWDRETAVPTASEPIRYNGYLRAARVYGMYYSDSADYAEAYAVEGEVKPGELLAVTERGISRNVLDANPAVLGFVSDNYAALIGADAAHETPVALCGRLAVWVSGKVRPGQFFCASPTPGAVRPATGSEPRGAIVALALEAGENCRIEAFLMRL